MKFHSQISETSKNDIRILGVPSHALIGNTTLNEMMCSVIDVERTPANMRMLDAICVAFIDHGLDPPSTIATRLAASCNVGMIQSLIAGLACMGATHCPIEQAMHSLVHGGGEDIYPGVGHPIHSVDPRVEPLFKMAKYLQLYLTYCELIKLRAESVKQPVNYAGCVAGILCDMGADEKNAGILPIISRLLGLSLHYKEQQAEKRFLVWQQ